METRLPREPVRLALQAKLSVAREQDAPRLLAALEAYEQECRALAAGVAQSDGRAHSWAALCLQSSRGAVGAQLGAEAEWAARTHRLIVDFLDQDEAARAAEPSDRLVAPAT
jgi:hypothetical protein